MTDAFNADTVARVAGRTGEPAWFTQRRLAALERYESLEWPDQSIEEWRHTDIRGLDIEGFAPAAPQAEVDGLDALPDAVRAAAIGEKGDRYGLSVQLDGDVVHCKLAPSLEEKGVWFGALPRAGAEREDLVRDVLGSCGVSDHEAKFEALNAAFASGGTFLYVPRGVVIDKPIQSVRWLTQSGVAIFPRVVILAEEGSQLTYIDTYGGDAADAESLSVATVEIYARQAAHVSYLAVQNLPQTVWHFNVQRAVIGRDATVSSLAATLGAKVSRSVVQSVLAGQGAHAEMLGAYFGDHEQHIDNRTLQLHAAPNTSSDLYYKGALKGSSRAIYSGLVDIEKEAIGADAQQANRNLLLSDGASADPSPFLEIKTSEVVRATHGVSVGRPDENVLFYLQSRGLDNAAAQNLYVKGFFQEIIDRVRVPEIREELEQAVEAELALED